MSKEDLNVEIDELLTSPSTAKAKAAKAVDAETKDTEVSEKDPESMTLMERLLDENPVDFPQEGDKIEGKMVGVDSMAIYVDLGVFGTGVVFGKDVKDGFGDNRKKLGVGDKLTAVILDVENEDGYVELSISEAVREEAWRDLEDKKREKTPIDVKILDANKGGLMVEVNGITGFMPVSQLTSEHYPRVEDGDRNKILEILRTYIGTEMTVCVLDLNMEDEKLIVSEKEANKDKEKVAIAELRVGDIVEGEASGIVDFGAFVKFLPPSKRETGDEQDKLEGLVHISQLDWQLIEDPRKIVKVGDKIKAKIISIEDTRISLSVRALKSDPWANVAEKYKVGQLVKGTVHKINHFGAFVYLDDDIHGLAHVSGFEQYPSKGIDEIVKIGDSYAWQIMSMEPNEHRMGLKFAGDVAAVAKAEASRGKKVEKQEASADKADKADKKSKDADTEKADVDKTDKKADVDKSNKTDKKAEDAKEAEKTESKK